MSAAGDLRKADRVIEGAEQIVCSDDHIIDLK